MAQSVWHRQDIENILRGVELSCQQMAAQCGDPEMDSYRRGFLAALAATATSFGIQVTASPFASLPVVSQRPRVNVRVLAPTSASDHTDIRDWPVAG